MNIKHIYDYTFNHYFLCCGKNIKHNVGLEWRSFDGKHGNFLLRLLSAEEKKFYDGNFRVTLLGHH